MDELTVVVLSEMTRTPKFNVSGGKDPWPYTSALLLGHGLQPAALRAREKHTGSADTSGRRAATPASPEWTRRACTPRRRMPDVVESMAVRMPLWEF